MQLSRVRWRLGETKLSRDQRLVLVILLLLAVRLALYAWLAGGAGALPEKLCRWDCAWYQGVAESGYGRAPKTWADSTFGQATWAFFPLFPKLALLIERLAGIPFVAAGVVLCNACLGVYVFLSARYLRLLGVVASDTALAAFLFAFPYTVYFSIPYTEAVYAVLTMAAFCYLRAGRVLPASLFAGLLSATRVTGVLLAPVIAWRCFAPAVRAWRAGDPATARRALADGLLPVALAPAGLFMFMGWLYLRTGDGLAFYHIQRAWGRPQEMPWTALWQGLTALDLFSFHPATQESLMIDALSGVAAMAMGAWLLSIGRAAEAWIVAVTTLVPLSHGLGSMARYTLAQPLFMVFLFELIVTTWLRSWLWAIVGAGAALQLLLAALWMRGFAFLH